MWAIYICLGSQFIAYDITVPYPGAAYRFKFASPDVVLASSMLAGAYMIKHFEAHFNPFLMVAVYIYVVEDCFGLEGKLKLYCAAFDAWVQRVIDTNNVSLC
jgi:hypothetical protein